MFFWNNIKPHKREPSTKFNSGSQIFQTFKQNSSAWTPYFLRRFSTHGCSSHLSFDLKNCHGISLVFSTRCFVTGLTAFVLTFNENFLFLFPSFSVFNCRDVKGNLLVARHYRLLKQSSLIQTRTTKAL